MLLAINKQIGAMEEACEAAGRAADELDYAADRSARMGGADLAREYGDMLDILVGLFESIKASVARWQEEQQGKGEARWVEEARQYEEAYRSMQRVFTSLERTAARHEDRGYPIANLARFREAKLDLDLLCQFSVDRMLKTDEAVRQGRRGRTTAEVRDELRRRLGA
jgi:hypothetical protein